MLQAECVCGSCGLVNSVNNLNVKRKDVYNENKDMFRITYYKCRGCNKVNIVQVDDITTISWFRELKSLIMKASLKRSKNETISPKDIRKKDKLTKRLKRAREQLKERYKKEKHYDEQGNEVFTDAFLF